MFYFSSRAEAKPPGSGSPPSFSPWQNKNQGTHYDCSYDLGAARVDLVLLVSAARLGSVRYSPTELSSKVAGFRCMVFFGSLRERVRFRQSYGTTGARDRQARSPR